MSNRVQIIPKLFLILAILALAGCAGKHPADVAATVVIPGTEGYFQVQEALIRMHEVGNAFGCTLGEDGMTHVSHSDLWQQISNQREHASAAYNLVWDSWYALSLVNTPDNVADFQEKLAGLKDWVAQLQTLLKEKP